MGWSGEIVFGDTYVAYFGAPDQNCIHAHAVYQIVLSANKPATVVDKNGVHYKGSALLIHPLVPHAILGSDPVTLIYLDPQSAFALDLVSNINIGEIVEISPDAFPLRLSDTPDKIANKLKSYTDFSSNHIDARLKNALNKLSAEPGEISVAHAANLSNISQSRLRTLAREQIGVPLSTWLLWRKLERAAREVAKGESLAEAALAGGFSDQAHFTRCMRRMFGVSPTETIDSLSRSKK